MSAIGVVAIGRNEGERLRRCLASAAGRPVVYVDSGSTDGSVEFARSLGVTVVELDLTTPFTAARARNAGLDELTRLHPDCDWVQFVDGDCEFSPGWFDRAAATLTQHPDLAVLCGRVRERHPEASAYNRLCDIEWDQPPGPADCCGGIALMRIDAVRAAGGFRASLIAGEEPELCLRLRQQGGSILRLPDDMVWHDAAMTHFGQWWRRAVRSGHAIAEVSSVTGSLWTREARSNWFYGLLLPLVSLALAWPTRGLSLLLLPAGFAFLFWRIHRYTRRRRARDESALYASYITLSKFPQMFGQVRYWRDRLLRRTSKIIEYKTPASRRTGILPVLREET